MDVEVPQAPLHQAAPVASQSQLNTSQQIFVNKGEQEWHEVRKAWTAKDLSRPPPPQRPVLDIDVATIASSEPFPHPVPLEDVVTCLVDYWENEDWD